MSGDVSAEAGLKPFAPLTLRSWSGPLPGSAQLEGTLVFADVSGFTRLTERLARRGKIGAEEMVSTISRVWESLLSNEDGGDVLKFAGDALLLLFRGEEHAQRACRRALSMQQELRRVGRITTPAGVVRLRMSIGVHSGTFQFFAVGGDHLELMVLGDAGKTLEMEAAASAEQVVISKATARLLDAARLEDHIPGGRLLRAVAGDAPPIGIPPPERHRPSRFVAPSLRDRLGDVDQEHRWAAVAFVQLGGIDDLLGTLGVDATFDRLQAFTVELMERLSEYGVLLSSCDLARDGAVFMLTAGVPDASGDDATRMLRVARSLVDGTDIPVRVGVHAGNVFVGDVGPPSRRAYVTMGDTTNLAARMMGSAPWGSVLATPAVLESAPGFVTTPVEPFHVKGKRKPVEASLVESVRAAGAGTDPLGPFVGREQETALLLETLSDIGSHGRVVELVGPEGSGKTRLVAELRRHAEEPRWITVHCDPFERTSAYSAARSLLRQVLGIPVDCSPQEAGRLLSEVIAERAPSLRALAPLLAGPLDAAVETTVEVEEIASRYRRLRTQQVASDLLGAALDRPTVMVIEDASAMDDASAELIAEALGRIEEQPWVVLITRTDETTGLHRGRGYDAIVVELDALTESAATELAMKLAETTPVPPHLIGEIVAHSGGNPLFLSELVMGGRGEAMPHTVEGILAARIDALTPKDRQALRYLSVLGETFDESILREAVADLEVLPDDEALWARLETFVRRDGKRVVFVNPLVRQVAYEGLSFSWRRRLHSRVADVLEQRQSEAVALHLLRAERWEEAWQAARHAGGDAERTGAFAVAAELYELALEAARHADMPGPDLAQVAASAGRCWGHVGVPEKALDAYSLAIAHTTDETERLLLSAARAGVHESAGRLSQALGLYSRAISGAEELTRDDARRRVLGVLHAGYASTRRRQGRLAEAIEHAVAAAANADQAGDEETLANVYHLLARLHAAAGNREEAVFYRDAALPIFAAMGDLAAQGTVLHDLAADAHQSDRLAEANWLFERAIDARTRAGDVVRAAASTNALGEVEFELGRWDEAEARFTGALRTWRGARSPEGIALASCNLGALALIRHAPGEALVRLEEAERSASRIGAEHLLQTVRLLKAGAYLALERWVEAWDTASGALAGTPDAHHETRARLLRARALMATGGQDRADAELSEATAIGADIRRSEPAALRALDDYLAGGS